MGQDAHMIEDMTPREMYKMLKDAQGRHHAVGRPFAVRRAEGGDALARHQPGTPSRLYGLCRHGRSWSRKSTRRCTIRCGSRCASRRRGRRPARAGRPRRSRRCDAEAAALAADPVQAEEARRAKKICNCKSVDARHHRGCDPGACSLTTVEGVRENTNASGGCGACAVRIEDILARAAAIVGQPAPAPARGGGVGRPWRSSRSARRPARSIR